MQTFVIVMSYISLIVFVVFAVFSFMNKDLSRLIRALFYAASLIGICQYGFFTFVAIVEAEGIRPRSQGVMFLVISILNVLVSIILAAITFRNGRESANS